MSRNRCVLSVIAFAVLAAGCSSVPYAVREKNRQAAYAAALGDPVRSFTFFSLYSWEPLGQESVAVYTRPNEAYVLDLGGGCPGLSFANTIGLTSYLNQVNVGFDKVLTGHGNIPCVISQIRPVDVKQLKLEREAQRKIEAQPRVDAAADDTAG